MLRGGWRPATRLMVGLLGAAAAPALSGVLLLALPLPVLWGSPAAFLNATIATAVFLFAASTVPLSMFLFLTRLHDRFTAVRVLDGYGPRDGDGPSLPYDLLAQHRFLVWRWDRGSMPGARVWVWKRTDRRRVRLLVVLGTVQEVTSFETQAAMRRMERFVERHGEADPDKR